MLTRWQLGSVLVLVIAVVCGRAPSARAQINFDLPPIDYEKGPLCDPATQLQKKLASGELKLEFDEKFGYLKSFMKALNISPTTQVMVFSKTSFQRNKINPRTPRVLYFTDDFYLGFCQRGDVLEITSVDPQQGGIFYSLTQHAEDKCELIRHTDTCLQCHASSLTMSVPGHFLRSVYPDTTGMPVFSSGTFRTTFQSPLKERWGGWYVSGTHGKMRHMGNMIMKNPKEPQDVDLETGANVTDLSKLVDVSPYLTPHSDIVALMVLEHQSPAHNQLTLASYQGRLALRDEETLRQMDNNPNAPRTASIQSRLDSAAEQLLKQFLFAEEAPLTDEVKGTSGFTEYFAKLGPQDSKGRSLRDFDLKTRLFKYPCSYLIYSAAFDNLPEPVRDAFYKKLHKILTNEDQRKDYAHLSAVDRKAILEILLETKQTLPASWKSGPAE